MASSTTNISLDQQVDFFTIPLEIRLQIYDLCNAATLSVLARTSSVIQGEINDEGNEVTEMIFPRKPQLARSESEPIKKHLGVRDEPYEWTIFDRVPITGSEARVLHRLVNEKVRELRLIAAAGETAT